MGLLMLGPHLTPDNLVEVLARAKRRTKKELAKLVRELHPLPRVPDVIEPLGPELVPARQPTWQQWVTSLASPVRELPRGELPSEWANDGDRATDLDGGHDVGGYHATRPDGGHHATGVDGGHRGKAAPTSNADGSEAAGVRYGSESPRLAPITGPQQYDVQFSTSEEHVQLVERAKALMARAAPGVSLGELHLEAMKLLVASLEKAQFAVNARPRKQREASIAPREARQVRPPRGRVEPCGAPLHDAPEVQPPRGRGEPSVPPPHDAPEATAHAHVLLATQLYLETPQEILQEGRSAAAPQTPTTRARRTGRVDSTRDFRDGP